MNVITWLLLIAALLPFVAATASKAGGKAYDNNDPRGWLAHQEGWRGRANAAQANLFEGLPFFFAAVLFAIYRQAAPARLAGSMVALICLAPADLGVFNAGSWTLPPLV